MGKDKKEEQSFQDLWNNIKRFNIPAARVPEGKRDGDRKNHGEIMAENLPNLVKDIKKFTDPVSSKNSKQDKFKKTTQSSPLLERKHGGGGLGCQGHWLSIRD